VVIGALTTIDALRGLRERLEYRSAITPGQRMASQVQILET
jgi:hypothetical protein